MGQHIQEMLIRWREVRQLGHEVTGRRATRLLIGTLPEEWLEMAESIYTYLWGVAVPISPREIDYETFCVELTAQWEEARDDALAFPEDNSVPTEMYIHEDAPPPTSDDEVQPSKKPRVHGGWISDDDDNDE
jgi:hypothetical protein